jgi:hypothetical protein
MKKFISKLIVSLLVIFLLLQLIPRKNNNILAVASARSIEKIHAIPDSALQILKTSCYDCHSNNTVYPWYANIQPVSLWLHNHIEEGKEELNFSEFGDYSIRRQFHKLEEISIEVEEGEMPLSSYTVIHKDAILNQTQKLVVLSWTKTLIDSFKMVYPADSLKRKIRF